MSLQHTVHKTIIDDTKMSNAYEQCIQCYQRIYKNYVVVV